MGAALIFPKLFSKVYSASAISYEQTQKMSNIKSRIGYANPSMINLMSTENIECINVGSKYNREERVKRISSNIFAQQYLDVCQIQRRVKSDYVNCGKCDKCLRTLIALEYHGVINKFENVFDVSEYFKSKEAYLELISERKDHFDLENLNLINTKGTHTKENKNIKRFPASIVNLGKVLDAKRVMEEINESINDYFSKPLVLINGRPSPLYQNTHGWDGIPLINWDGDSSVNGLKFTDTPNAGIDFTSQPTDFLERCPYLKTVFENLEAKFNSKIQFARCMRLKAGGNIAPHVDQGRYNGTLYSFGKYKYRMAIPLVADYSYVDFTIEKVTRYLTEGNLYYTNVNKVHSVRNNSLDVDRIHLVIDFKKTPELQRAISDGKPAERNSIDYNQGNEKQNKKLIISFSGYGVAGSQRPAFIFNCLRKQQFSSEYDTLFVRDLSRNWYFEGVGNIADSLDQFVDYLKKFIKDRGYTHVITIGTSSGGYAALYIGAKLVVNKIIAFSPPTILVNKERKKLNDNRWSYATKKMLSSAKKLKIAAGSDQMDLSKLQFKPQQKIYVLYGVSTIADKDLDRKHAVRLALPEGSICKEFDLKDNLHPHRLSIFLNSHQCLQEVITMCLKDDVRTLVDFEVPNQEE